MTQNNVESLALAKLFVDQWRNEYNQQRSHSSVSYETPDEFGAICNRRFNSGYALLPSAIAEKVGITHTTNNLAELDFKLSTPWDQVNDTVTRTISARHHKDVAEILIAQKRTPQDDCLLKKQRSSKDMEMQLSLKVSI